MQGLMMDFQLTVPAMLRHAEAVHRHKTVVARQADRSLSRATYADVFARSRRLIGALRQLGVRGDDRVATYCWNHQAHLEAYFAVPAMGAVLHTLNIRIAPEDLAFVIDHADDRVLIADRVLLPALARVLPRPSVRHVVLVGAGPTPEGMLDYETLIAAAEPEDFDDALDERRPAAMCYTSGTTGRPKGVVYTHRSTVLHSLAGGLWNVELVRERDVVLPVVPMFHANAWGLPYTAMLHGAAQVHPGPHLDPASLLELVERERVTLLSGVPTIANALLHALDTEPGRWDISSLRSMTCGGSAVPEHLMRAFQTRHGIRVVQGWGMTEMSPIASMGVLHEATDALTDDERYRLRASQGRPLPLIETRVRGDDGLVPHDGEATGELEVRGPWVLSAYHDAPDTLDRFTEDGWFRTGDVVSIDAHGYIFIRDRAKDVIKSGGEWISSVALENKIMEHPAVLEAAVIGLAHPQWDERPLALVVRRAGTACSSEDILAFLAPAFPKWWLPNAVEFVDAIPRTTVGKFNKLVMRQQYRGYYSDGATPATPSAVRATPSIPTLPT